MDLQNETIKMYKKRVEIFKEIPQIRNHKYEN